MPNLMKLLAVGGLILSISELEVAAADASADKLTIVNPHNMYDPTPLGYSVAVLTPAEARMAYISGQGGSDDSGAFSPEFEVQVEQTYACLLYTSPSPRDATLSRMPSSA